MLYLLSSQHQSALPQVARFFRGCAVADQLGSGTATGVPTASPVSAGDPTVISDWNAIAVSTLLADSTKQPVEDFLYSGVRPGGGVQRCGWRRGTL